MAPAPRSRRRGRAAGSWLRPTVDDPRSARSPAQVGLADRRDRIVPADHRARPGTFERRDRPPLGRRAGQQPEVAVGWVVALGEHVDQRLVEPHQIRAARDRVDRLAGRHESLHGRHHPLHRAASAGGAFAPSATATSIVARSGGRSSADARLAAPCATSRASTTARAAASGRTAARPVPTAARRPGAPGAAWCETRPCARAGRAAAAGEHQERGRWPAGAGPWSPADAPTRPRRRGQPEAARPSSGR